MSELISGKEALIALANGEDVEYLEDDNKWHIIDKETVVISALLDCKLRLKPRTITINGIEVKPLTKNCPIYENDGVVKIECDSQEDAVKLVAALRSIFK